MTDDGNAPTVPDSTSRPSGGSLVTPPERYVMRTLLGRGGMGEVWLARDVRIDRDIAIKLMRRDRVGDASRFLREARVQGRLEHPSIVPVHDLGEHDAPYFAMKRLTGTTLLDALTDPAKWPRRALLARLVDVCLAVEFAHPTRPCLAQRQQHRKRQPATGGIPANDDVLRPVALCQQPAIGQQRVLHSGRIGMFRRQPVVRDQQPQTGRLRQMRRQLMVRSR